jgi:hypothetical protein
LERVQTPPGLAVRASVIAASLFLGLAGAAHHRVAGTFIVSNVLFTFFARLVLRYLKRDIQRRTIEPGSPDTA